MNDDFLTRFTKPPRPEFAAELYRRINPPATVRPSFAFRAALAASALCAVLAVTLLVSPAARAAVLSFLRDIGGVSFQETTAYPGSEDISTVPEEILSLEDAQAKLPYAVSLPTWVPEGFTRDADVRITHFSEEYTPVTITWRGKTADGGDTLFELMIGQNTGSMIVGPDALETVQINGQDAAVVSGMWSADEKAWATENTGLFLIWSRGDTTYSLFSPALPREDLILIAESIP
jgi:Domain of unknown function (DUF4367)